MKVLVLGSQGQLGRCLADQFSESSFDVTYSSRKNIDISDLAHTKTVMLDINPDVVVNATAYTAVDKAESEAEEATLINEIAVANLACICKEIDIWLIHISTDYVFDGVFNQPYKETDKPSPQCVYGKTKFDGERAIRRSECKFLIIRTAWLFSEYGTNFVKTMLRLCETHSEISVVSDQFGSPTYAQDLAGAIIQTLPFLEQDIVSGIYHYVGGPKCSWAEFAQLIFDEVARQDNLETPTKVKAINSSEYPTPVKRPLYSVLDTSLFESTFSYKSSDWSDGVSKVVRFWNGQKN